MTRPGDEPQPAPTDAPAPPTAGLEPARRREDVVPFGDAVRTPVVTQYPSCRS